jgi:hypothetical protein
MNKIPQPSKKSEEMENAISMMFKVDRRASIISRACTTCGGDCVDFKDALSEKEFQISGMCQNCQDSVFG